MKNIFKIILFLAAIFSAQLVFSCTDIEVVAKDGSRIIARTMEFTLDLKSNILTRQRGFTFKTEAPFSKPGLNWQTKYGYVYFNALNKDFTVDGLNEKGLAFEYLYLPGLTQYQEVPTDKANQALPYYQFGDWVLSNFATVEEVKNALQDVYIFEQKINGLGNMVFPLHAAIHDKKGNGIVVEFIKGKVNVYDYAGVMTNAPTYDWQLANLGQYLNLAPFNPKPIVLNGVSYAANGEGSGMLGLPGDVSPPSRFVKMATMVKSAFQVDNAAQAVNLAEHIINNVDIPAGFVRSKANNKVQFETTEWTVFKDLTNLKLYYHTYNDTNLKVIDLNKIDFSKDSKPLILHLGVKPIIPDVTSNFRPVKT